MKTLTLILLALTSTPLFAIYNGDSAGGGQFNQVIGYQTSLGNCGGIFISEKVILTAAHCITDRKKTIRDKGLYLSLEKRSKQSMVGIHSIIKNEDFFTIDENGSFSSNETAIDVALIVLEKDMATTLGAKITSLNDIISTDEMAIGSPVTVVAFGDDQSGDSKIKRKASFTFARLSNVSSIVLNNKDSKVSLCHGDSGGAVYISQNNELKLVGLMSAIIQECGSKSQTSYAVPLHLNLNWITDKLQSIN